MTTFWSYDLLSSLFAIICSCLSIYSSIHSHSHLYSYCGWAPTVSQKGQCMIVSSVAIASHLEGRPILFCFHFGCCSHNWLTWASLTSAAYNHFLTNTFTERAWFCKYTICYRQLWISLSFWFVCWGQALLGGPLCHTLGFERELSWSALGQDCL